MVQTIDEWIMRRCTRASHWFQRRTGKSSYFIARAGLVLLLVSSLFDILDYFRQGTLSWETTGHSAFLGGINIFGLTILFLYMSLEDERAEMYQERFVGNIVGRLPAALRVFAILFILYSVPHDILCKEHGKGHPVLEILGESWVVGICIFLYFAPVHPLPKEFPEDSR